MARIVKFIATEVRKGVGTKENPVRLCPQLWTLAGELIAEYDPCAGTPVGDAEWKGGGWYNPAGSDAR